MEKDGLLKAEGLRVSFKIKDEYVQVLRGIDIDINRGEILGILGESGSGKTVFASTIIGLLRDEDGRIDSGKVIYEGRDLLRLKEGEIREIRGQHIGYIFQDPSAALDPHIRVGRQVEEIFKAHRLNFDKDSIIKGMKDAGIDNAELIYDMYPSQLSGGQCQRVMISIATILKPRIVIADEPTTAIDASLQKKVIELLKKINRDNETAVLLITHDFEVAKYLCSRVVIMYGGLVMEKGNIDEIMERPMHPYTEELLKCVGSLNDNDTKLYTLDGMPPNPLEFREECPFFERCRYRTQKCRDGVPEMVRAVDGREVRCIRQL